MYKNFTSKYNNLMSVLFIPFLMALSRIFNYQIKINLNFFLDLSNNIARFSTKFIFPIRLNFLDKRDKKLKKEIIHVGEESISTIWKNIYIKTINCDLFLSNENLTESFTFYNISQMLNQVISPVLYSSFETTFNINSQFVEKDNTQLFMQSAIYFSFVSIVVILYAIFVDTMKNTFMNKQIL